MPRRTSVGYQKNIMKRRFNVLPVLLFTVNILHAQTTSSVYKSRIDIINSNIYNYFYDSVNVLYYETDHVRPNEKKHSYLWPLCALIQAANEAENVQSAKDYMPP